MAHPNIFSVAPKELIQDAFIAWLSEWANRHYEKSDPELYRISRIFIKSLLAKSTSNADCKNITIEKVQAELQVGHIDILLTINDQHLIVIEDKIGSSEHSNQLERYKSDISSRKSLSVHYIYFKTIEQPDLKEVTKAKYDLYSREDLLNVLNDGITSGIQNNIFKDYYLYIKEIDDIIKGYPQIDNVAYSSKKIRSIASPWIGFYSKLKQEELLKNGGWGYVHRGDFWGFWFYGVTIGDIDLYLQIEEKNLCFKINTEKSNHSDQKLGELRNLWFGKIQEASSIQQFVGRRPEHFGTGKTMTVFEKNDYFSKNKNGDLDYDTTLKNILDAIYVVDHLKNQETVKRSSP